LSGGGGRCGVAGNIDLICGGVTQYGSRGGSGGLNCYESIPTNESNGMLVITVCRGVVAIPSGSYNHVFTQDTVTGNRLYSIPVPVGTTSTIVQVLGAGWKGNASVGSIYTTCATRATAGGGGGGYARSQYTTPVTSTAVLIEVQVACGGFQSSSAVFINGVLEARAYTAYGHEGGGLGNANNPVNYARNGVVYRGGHGGSGYRSCTSAIARGGAGGGAAWQGGNGGQGANTSSSNAGGGGGGAAGTTGAGSAGSTASPSTRGGSGGSAGAPGFGAGGSSTTTISQGNPGVNGGGGQGGGTTGGASYGGAGSTNPLFGPGNLTAVNYYQNPSTSVYGPGGGGGGSYSSTTYTGYGGSGGNYGGGAGGGDLAGNGAPGLVVITFTVCGPLAAQYTTSSQSTSDVQFID